MDSLIHNRKQLKLKVLYVRVPRYGTDWTDSERATGKDATNLFNQSILYEKSNQFLWTLAVLLFETFSSCF